MRIMDSRDQVLQRKTVRPVKVLWKHRVEELTWECEDMMRANYPFLFDDDGMLFNHLVVMTDACACDCLYMCVNFGDEILLRGEGGGGGGGGGGGWGKNVKTLVNFNFFFNTVNYRYNTN